MEITTFMYAYLLVDFMFWQRTASEHIWIEIYSYIGRKHTRTITLPKICNNTLMQNTSKKCTWKKERKKENYPEEVSWRLSNRETVQIKLFFCCCFGVGFFFFQSAFKWLWGPSNLSCCQKSRVGARSKQRPSTNGSLWCEAASLSLLWEQLLFKLVFVFLTWCITGIGTSIWSLSQMWFCKNCTSSSSLSGLLRMKEKLGWPSAWVIECMVLMSSQTQLAWVHQDIRALAKALAQPKRAARKPLWCLCIHVFQHSEDQERFLNWLQNNMSIKR